MIPIFNSRRKNLFLYAIEIQKMIPILNSRVITPPPQFRDDYKPIAAPRKKIIPPPPQFRDNYKPVAAPRTKITKLNKALKNAVKAYEVDIKNEKDSLGQLNSTSKWTETYLKPLLNNIKGFKLVETLKIAFKKPAGENTTTKQLISIAKLHLL